MQTDSQSDESRCTRWHTTLNIECTYNLTVVTIRLGRLPETPGPAEVYARTSTLYSEQDFNPDKTANVSVVFCSTTWASEMDLAVRELDTVVCFTS